EFSAEGERLRIKAEFDTDLFRKDTVCRWLDGWKELLDRARPSSMLCELIACQCRQGRDRTAVVEPGGPHVTYGQLWHRAGALAARLVSLGIGVDNRVGIALERDARLII